MIDRDVPHRLLALEASAKMVLQQVGDGTIAAVVASVRPLAVAEATEPASILLVFTIDHTKEWGESLLGGLLTVLDGDGVDGHMKSGVVRRVEVGSKPEDINTEVSSLGVRN